MPRKMMIGDYFAMQRAKMGWTLREAQKKSGVGHSTIFQLEAGNQRNPSFGVVARLAEAYGCSLDDVARRTKYK